MKIEPIGDEPVDPRVRGIWDQIERNGWPEHESGEPFAIAYFDEDGLVSEIGCVTIGEPEPNVKFTITTEKPPEDEERMGA